MILRRLVEYADRLEKTGELTPPNYGTTMVNWIISINVDGGLEGFTAVGEKQGIEMIVPRYSVKRTAVPKPELLADEGEYVLGISRDPAKSVEKHHQSFVDLTQLCAQQTRDDSVKAVAKFLENWDEGKYRDQLPNDLQARHRMTFRVGKNIPAQDNEKVREFWMQLQTPDVGKGTRMMCLVSGEVGSVAQRLPHSSGVPDKKGSISRGALVSAQNPAFMSYGLTNSLTSPISHSAGERFAKAIDSLISSEKSKLYMGAFVYMFWTREESQFDFLSLVEKPKPETVQSLFASPYRGKRSSRVEGNDFYALSLTRSKARLTVRDYIESKVSLVADNLEKWFIDQRIVNPAGEFDGYFGVKSLARASSLRGNEKRPADADLRVQPSAIASLVHAAINGRPLDLSLLALLVQRIQKGVQRKDGSREHVTHLLAACTKLVLSRTEGLEMAEKMESLDVQSKDRAYNCGRLLAELEALQRAAIPGVKATIVDRYYGAASSTPASVFGTLMRGHTAHIGKVRKERPGVGAAIQDRIGEITTSIGPDFPTTLTMRQQAVFALGYYHQRANNRAEAKAAKEARENRNREEN